MGPLSHRLRAWRFVVAYQLLIRIGPKVELAGAGAAIAGTSGVLPTRAVPTQEASRDRVRISVLRPVVVTCVAGLFALELWALRVNYGLRVTSDTPTFLALLREMALHPFHRVSPFVPGAGLETSHATPYMQALAWLWGFVAPHDRSGAVLPDPVAAYRLLALAGLVVSAALLHATFLWVRRCAGTRAAWISLPIMLLLFGPAHVIWAGDLSLNGFLYASFYPQTLALALLLYTLVLVAGDATLIRIAPGILAVAATMVVHPFTGVLLALLLCAEGTLRAFRREGDWFVPSVTLVGGYALAAPWPAYSLDHALAAAGPDGRTLVLGCAILPVFWWLSTQAAAKLGLTRRATEGDLKRGTDAGDALTVRFAFGGLTLVLVLAAWQVWLLRQPFPDPLVHSNRLALYWVEDRWRWPLMFGAGAVGVLGLFRLARRGIALPALWFAGCFGIGLAGIAGLPLPVWWRFLLFCQLPLALAVADVLARSRSGAAKGIVVATFCLVCAFKLATLLTTSKQLTYFGSSLQPAYALGDVIPPGPGLVASDPFTAYYIPGVTGHRVLSVTKAHVGSSEELAASERGYGLIHEYYAGDRWWEAAQAMWKRGVRYVVVEKQTSIAAPTLAAFSTGPTPLVRTAAQRRQLGSYFYRNNRVGTLIHDSPTYAVYELDRRKLWP
jgi:hypothetical protein